LKDKAVAAVILIIMTVVFLDAMPTQSNDDSNPIENYLTLFMAFIFMMVVRELLSVFDSKTDITPQRRKSKN